MSVYKKLQEARVKLQNKGLKPTGKNPFAGYQYFELHDFLPAINNIFADIGLCAIFSQTTEMATLLICDVEKEDSAITFNAPYAEALLKGCHPVQNLGASISYLRRYLWMMAMEISECDPVDSSKPEDKAPPKPDNKTTGSPVFQETLSKILNSNSADFSWIEVKSLTKEQRIEVQNACHKRRLELIQGCNDKEQLSKIMHSIPEQLKAHYQEEFELKLDLLRDVA